MILVDRLERSMLSERQVAAMLRAGGHDVEAQLVSDAMDEFDAALASPPEPESETDRIRRELGV